MTLMVRLGHHMRVNGAEVGEAPNFTNKPNFREKKTPKFNSHLWEKLHADL